MHSQGLTMVCGDTEPTTLGLAAACPRRRTDPAGPGRVPWPPLSHSISGAIISLTGRRGSLTPSEGEGPGDWVGALTLQERLTSKAVRHLLQVQPPSIVCPSGPRTAMPGFRAMLSTGFRKRYKEIPAFFLAEARMWEEGIHAAIFTFLQKS